jgi:predicted ATPase/DNA-binding winged helix-turn-helix (wHTH) protein
LNRASSSSVGSPNATRPGPIRFARFELQPEERRLLAAGAPVALGPRAFDLLVVLVERAGRLLTKDELLERVWPQVIVEEAALQMQISALRKVLGREAIMTVTGRGYRFALDVAVGDAGPASQAAPRHNLPQPLNSFIGREDEVAELKTLIGTTRLLTLSGAGGCGKTRLALQLAAGSTHEHTDGVWLVELAALANPMLLPQTVAQVFGLKDPVGQSLAEALADTLASKQLLLVLDNAEHLLAACAQFCEALLRACAGLTVLVTSRERLGIVGELTFQVPPLSAPGPHESVTPDLLQAFDSTRLFIERAKLQQPRFAVTARNATALAAICHRLGGIPLAIELAAARVRSMPPEEVSRRLDRRFELLTGGSRTALPRHQTLRSLIDWSYDLLGDGERALLCRVSIFAGGWTFEAAEQVCIGEGVERRDLLDLLTSLVDKNLVVAKDHRGSTRYGLLETVRYYARDRLAERGEEATQSRRHFDYLLALAESADGRQLTDDQGVWLERLEAEHDNLRAALAWCSTSSAHAGDGLRLAAALGSFWRSRGHLGEGRHWFAALLGAAPNMPDSASRADALRWAGVLAMSQADYTAARVLQQDALALYRALGDRLGIARVLNNLGLVAVELEDHAAAQSLFEESMALRRELGDQQGISFVLCNLGMVAHLIGRHAEAQARYEEALDLQRTLGDRAMVAKLTNNLGASLYLQGDYRKARALLQEALAIWTELHSRFELVLSLEDFACLAWLEGQPARAARLWGRAAQLRQDMGQEQSPTEQAATSPHVGATRSALGDAAFEAAWAEGRALPLDEVTRELLAS